jgi:His-Xaa-Ser system radical SAM maturase HxsC
LEEYAAVLVDGNFQTEATRRVPIICASTDHLDDGDIVALDPSGQIRTLFRRHARSNFLFTTDRCNSYCLMCSQPPRLVDDRWRLHELLRLIELIDVEPADLGITGGEPTLLGDGLIELLIACRNKFPQTALHVLSNGRLLADGRFAERLGAIRHHDLMFGVPLYSDIDYEHDYIVQAKGAWRETLLGLHHLGGAAVPIEIRVVIHRLTAHHLGRLAEFIYRNLTFVSKVAFMGLEPTGLAIPNLAQLWIDPADYATELEGAVLHLARRGIPAHVYNHQLCAIPQTLWPYNRRAISEWKNEFTDECETCAARDMCGGFFASSGPTTRSRLIRRIVRQAPGDNVDEACRG